MRASILRDFFRGTLKPTDLASDLADAWEQTGPKTHRLRMTDDMTEDYEVLSTHLVSLCDAVLSGAIPPDALRAVGFGMIASDHLVWDGDTPDGERVAETVHDWASPEVNYALNPDNVAKFRHRLVTGENLFAHGRA